MADGVSIPGFNDKYKTENSINKIMESKRVKLKEMEDEKEGIKEQKEVWNEIRKKSITFQDQVKKLYGVENPFDKKISLSTDENAFSANVNKNVEIGEYKIEILQKAQAHKIASDSLDKKHKIPQGEYNILVGKDKIRIRFSGGTVEKFAQELREDSKDKLKASVRYDTSKTQVLVLEAGKSGSENYISFDDEKTKRIFRDMGFFEDVVSYDKEFYPDKNRLVNLSKIKRDPQFLNDKTLLVRADESFRYNISEKIPYKKKLIMEVDLKLNELDPNKEFNYTDPTGPNYTKSGDVDLYGIYIEGESASVKLPNYVKPEKPKVITDDHYIEIITNKRTIKLDELDVTTNQKTLKFDMSEIINQDEVIEGVIFKNQNTYKNLEVSKIRFYDEGSKAGVRFSHEITKPQDAKLLMDGIEIVRDTNTIDDLIKGMTLFIFDKTNREETLKVDRDYEGMVTTITEFLKEFNEFVELVNKETNANINDEGERGTFAGDYSLVSLVSKLRLITMNPHETSFGDELSLLAQIGISTNANKYSRNGIDKNKLKGLLEIEENKFIEKMEKYPRGVKELFGKDTDDDYIIDTGIAYEIETILKAYTLRGEGFFDTKNKYFDNQIANKDKEIKKYEVKLEDEERKLKEKFFKMEKAANELEENRNKFNNLYNNTK